MLVGGQKSDRSVFFAVLEWRLGIGIPLWINDVRARDRKSGRYWIDFRQDAETVTR